MGKTEDIIANTVHTTGSGLSNELGGLLPEQIISIPTSRVICGDIQFTGSDVEITDVVALYSTFDITQGYKQTQEIFDGTQTVVWNNGLGADGFKYGKKIEGADGYTRVDTKPVFNEISATTEYRINGDWYDTTGTKLPPQSYMEDENGKLVEFGVVSSAIIGITKGDYVPSIVENKVTAKEVEADEFIGKNACTAWVNFNGATIPPTIRDSYNVSDIIRTGIGKYELVFTKGMDNSDYGVLISHHDGFTQDTNGGEQYSDKTVSGVKCSTYITSTSTARDVENITLFIIGGKD